MSEFNTFPSPDAQHLGEPTPKQADLISALGALAEEIAIDEGLFAEVNEQLAQETTLSPTGASEEALQTQARLRRRLAVNSAKFAEMMDVAGYWTRVQHGEL